MEGNLSNWLLKSMNSCLNYTRSRFAQPCFLCGARSRKQLLCPDCIGDLPRLPDRRCPVCALPTPQGEVCGACLKHPPAFDRTIAAWQYAFPASVLIQQLKYAGELALASWLAGQLALELDGMDRPDLIIPMPLHANRLNQRGFNQAGLIGRRLATILEIPIDYAACRRVKATRPQVELPYKERSGNLKGAFACDRDLAGKRVALVDDVMTSGASLEALARVVRKAGATEVSAWVVARTTRN
jgi:ComF family protein